LENQIKSNSAENQRIWMNRKQTLYTPTSLTQSAENKAVAVFAWSVVIDPIKKYGPIPSQNQGKFR
jgi:hypothetical protein